MPARSSRSPFHFVTACLACALVALASRTYAQDAPREIVAPRQLTTDPVPYPEGAQGDAVVVLELEVEKDGTVTHVVVKEGPPPFDETAREAVKAWRFSPATRGGIPVRARVLARIAFHPPTPPAPPQPPEPETTKEGEPESPAAPPSPGIPAAPEPIEVRVLGEGREELGSTHIPRNETRLVPGAFADPFRVVEVLPGVAPVLSGVPYFTVRGAPPGDVGYSIDGIRVPLLFHVGAGPSVIAPGLVDRVDLFPSVYPARFGRSGGGIMAGETRAPGDVARGEAQARIFDAGGMAEQPFLDKRGSVLVGGRYGYTGALLSVVAPEYSLAYWDYQGRLAFRVSEHDRLTAFSFGAHDFLRNEVISRTLFHVEFHRLDLRWDHDTDSGHLRVAATLSSDLTLNAAENSRDPGSATKSRGARLRFELDERVARGLRFRAGGDVGLERFDDDREVHGAAGFVPFGAHTDRYGGGWIDLVERPAPGVEVVPSFRFDVFQVRDDTVLAPEPRLATRLKLAEGVAWISAFGVTHQVPTFLVPVPGSNISRFDASNHEVWQASQTIELALPWRALAKATLFRNVTFASQPGLGGHDYGMELFLRRDFTERLGGFASYTLSRANRTAPGAHALSTFDRTHVLSLVLGYDLGAGYRFGGRFYVESGRPYEIACPTPGCVGGAPPPPGSPPSSFPYVVSGRFPMFSRLDVRFEKKWTFASGAWIAGTFEWFNSLLTREYDNVAWTPAGLVESGRSPLTLPSIGIEGGY
jgi:TonB family protein